jgi:hypothetical protein
MKARISVEALYTVFETGYSYFFLLWIEIKMYILYKFMWGARIAQSV